MMKKIMSILLVLVLMLSFAACSEEKETTSKRKDRDTEKTSDDGGLFAEPEERYEQEGSEGLVYGPDYRTGGYALTGIGTCTTPNIVVASSYNGKPVTSISYTFTESLITQNSGMDPAAITGFSIAQTVWHIDRRLFSTLEEFCTSLTYNEYEGIRYIGSEYNPYYVLVKANDPNMTSCTIHPDTGIIGAMAFRDCKALTAVHVPDGVVSILDYAFEPCENLTEFTLPNSLRYVGSYAISRNGESLSYNVYNDIRYLGNDSNPYLYLCRPVDKTKSAYEVHPDTKIIGSNAFEDIKVFTDINIPEGVVSIGAAAFLDSKALRHVQIPESVTAIEDYTFEDCDCLESVTLHSNISYIGYRAFSECVKLSELTFPGDAPKFEKKAFNQDNLTVYYNAGNPTWTEEIMQSYNGTVNWVPMS